MTLALGIAAVVLCALAGALSPAIVRRLPPPAADAVERPADEPAPPSYPEVAAVPWFAPMAALGSAGGAALVCLRLDAGWDWAVVLPAVPVLVVLALVDARTRLLPSRLVLPATGLALAVTVAEAVVADDRAPAVGGLIGLVAVRTAFWLLWWLHSAGLGFGDVRLAALLGLLLGRLGLAETFVGLYAAFVLFAVPGLVWALVRRDRSLLKRAYPFGPFLVLGAFVGIALGPLWT